MSNSSLSCADYGSNYSGFIAPPVGGKPYVAIGYLDDFKTDFQSCCPSTVNNFEGVAKLPEDCFYYCVVEGSATDLDSAYNCTKEKGEKKSNGRSLDMARVYPQDYKAAASWNGDGRLRIWGYVVLGVGFVGAICGVS